MITPAGFRLLVKPDPIETETESGIILYTKERDVNMEKAAQIYGTLVAIGPVAWLGVADDRHWAKVGDRISYSKYGGKFITDTETGEDFMLINDQDVTAVITEESNDE